jgi:hypothetical protein
MAASGLPATLFTGRADGSNVPQMSTATAACHSSVAVGGVEFLAAAGSGCTTS